MAAVEIPTARLNLVLQTPDEVLAWVESLPPADRAEVSPDWIARVQSTAAGDPWSLSFSAVERATGSAVGGCAFKGPPDADGVVELAYGIDPPHRGCGFATEAATALAEFAFSSGRVRLVRAHSKPENGASARVLTKCGFEHVGEVIDPEDGLVWRWERSKNPAKSGRAVSWRGREAAVNDQSFRGLCSVIAALVIGAAIVYHAHRPPEVVSGIPVGRYQFQSSTPPGVIWVLDTTTGEVRTR